MKSDQINRTIGTRIAACRVAKDLTRAELAERVGGMTAKLVGRIERGTSALTADRLVQIAKALGVTSSVLTAEEEFGGWLDKPAPAEA